MFAVTVILLSFACLMFSTAVYVIAETFESFKWRENALGAMSAAFVGILIGLGVAAIQFFIHLTS